MNLSSLGAGYTSLRKMRQFAQERLDILFNFLGYKGYSPEALQDLNNKIQEFHNTTASFNGIRLRNEIINPLKGVVVDKMQVELQNFQSLVNSKQQEIGNVFLQVIQKMWDEKTSSNGEITKDIENEIATEFYQELNQMTFYISSSGTKTGGGKRVTTEYKDLTEKIIKKLKAGISTYNFSGDVDPNIKQLIHKDISFSRRLLLLAQSRGINVEGIYEQQIQAPIFEIEETSDDSLKIYFDILQPFLDVMQPSDARGTKGEKAAQNYFNGLPPKQKAEEIQELCNRAITFLEKFFDTTNLSTNRATFLREKFGQAIRDIITQYPGAIFTGRNEQGVIGILGEIQGLYYVYSILGDLDPKIAPETLVSWIGGDTSKGDGAKTGADLIIKLAKSEGFGIQIKNSMDLTGDTSFSEFVLNSRTGDKNFFQQLVNFGIPGEIVSLIEDIFTMKSFNIPYHMQGDKAVKGKPKGNNVDEYYQSYDKLNELVEKANRYMALAAAMIMRIQYLAEQDFKESNILWIIGGTAIVSAVQILDNLINQIDGQLNGNLFKTSSRTISVLDEKGFTIVDYINDKGRMDKGLKTILSTSYNFHKI